MASTGKKGKKNKGKTVPLNDFLSNNTNSWIDQVDEADKLGEFNRKPTLPAAPRAAIALELDESKIPKSPPYVAYLSNLSYELEEADILNAFADLTISIIRLPRDEHSGRLKGFGYVEFNDKGSLISALQKHEATIRGRRIKIDVADNEGERRRGGMKDNRDRDFNYDSEKTLGDWRSGPRSEFAAPDDRRGPVSGRKEYGGFRDRERDKDRDGMDRSRGDRDSSWRNNERRFGSDRDRDRDRDGRSSYGGRRSYNDPESNYSEPKTRKKLNLKPRSKPIEEVVVKEEPVKKERLEKDKPSAASIFGGAKPVDTAAREREIEERLAKERVAKSDKDPNVSKSSDGENSNTEAAGGKSAPEENVWIRKSLKSEAKNITSRGPSSGKTDDLDEPPPADDNEKKMPEDSLDHSQYPETKKNDDYDSDGDSRYSRHNKNESRYNDRNRESDRSYRRDDKDRRDRKGDERRERGYDSERRGGNGGGKNREPGREGDSRRFSERDGDHTRFSNDREGDNKRSQERDDYANNKGPRGDRRGGPLSGDKNKMKGTQERERGPQNKEKPKDHKKSEDGIRMPKFKEVEAPNYIGTNKYSFLEEDGISE